MEMEKFARYFPYERKIVLSHYLHDFAAGVLRMAIVIPKARPLFRVRHRLLATGRLRSLARVRAVSILSPSGWRFCHCSIVVFP